MSREIRRVPPDWEHPKYEPYEVTYAWQRDAYRPLYDEDFNTAFAEWFEDAQHWAAGTHSEQRPGNTWLTFVEEVHGPPDTRYYRHRTWTADEATAYQVYSTVSEGTPVSPVLPTVDALREWLIAEWHLSPEGADYFIRTGWVPSGMAFIRPDGTGTIATGEQVPDMLAHSKD